ncbi:hypothetical protein P9112_008576 [Eukaryota sp. TZLM1-RC]
MCKSHHIGASVEPLVRKLLPEKEDYNTFRKRRADLITPGALDKTYVFVNNIFSLLPDAPLAQPKEKELKRKMYLLEFIPTHCAPCSEMF